MLTNILQLIITTFGSIFLLIVILRFLLQLVRADFYNPVSQAIVKITKPLLHPLRRIIPSIASIDTASIVLIMLVQLAVTFLLAVVLEKLAVFGNPLLVILWGLVGALTLISSIFFWSMIIMIIGSFVAPFSHHPLLVLANQLVNPLTAPIRKLIPPIGGVLDISPIFVLLGLQIVDMLLVRAAQMLMLNPSLVLGNW
jgi:YggT family protein